MFSIFGDSQCILGNSQCYFWVGGDDGTTGSGVPWVEPAGLTSFSSECYMSLEKKKKISLDVNL